MRISILLPTLALASSITAWSDYEAAVKCGQKNPDVNRAITAFCAKTDIVVPSDYASNGFGSNGYHVSISGKKCNPPQWVPQGYCRMQFAQMCANGDGKGLKNTRFGRNQCQGWHIVRRS